jgi:hypothetical protein
MERDLAALLPMQCEDGGWELSWVYKYGSSGLKIGNRGLTTAFALNAIAALYPRSSSASPRERQGINSNLKREPQCDCCVLATTATEDSANVMFQRQKRKFGESGLPSPRPSPEPEMRKRARTERRFSASALAKGVYDYFFPSFGSPQPQACTA